MKIYICDKRNLTFKLKNKLNVLPFGLRESADFYLLWTIFALESRIKEAKELGIKTILLQHGRRAANVYKPPLDKKLITDYIFVWGKQDYERLVKYGISKKRIYITGCPFFEDLGIKYNNNNKINILFETIHWMPEAEENFTVLEKLIEIADKYDCMITVKIMHLNDKQRFSKYDINLVYSEFMNDNNIPIIIDTIKKADIVISIAEGTMSLIAEALDIPVIVITDVWEEKKFKNKGIIIKKDFNYSTGVYKIKLENLVDTIIRALNNDTKKEQRKMAAIDYGGLGLNYSEKVIKYLENIKANN